MLKDKILEPHTPPHNKKRAAPKATLYPLCSILSNHHTFKENYLKILDLIYWLKELLLDKT